MENTKFFCLSEYTTLTSCHYAKFVMSFYIFELWFVCYHGSCNWFVVMMVPGTSVNYLYDV